MDLGAALARYDELKVKGFLGPTLKEDPRLADLGSRAARAAGIDVDNAGKLRCPDGAPGAGRFTDMQQSNCQIPLTDAEKLKNSAGKKAYQLTPAMVEFKAGLFHSSGRIGRALQAAGTAILPGDVSNVRHPIRSREASALTPGKIGANGGIGGPKMIRCPAGYEHGGRFSPADLSGCGRQLFTPPKRVAGGGSREGRAGKPSDRTSTASGTKPGRVGVIEGEGTALRGGRGGRAVQISRSADIQDVRPASTERRSAGIARALRTLSGKGEGMMLVRRDGSLLDSSADLDTLSSARTSRDMQGAGLVRGVSSLKGIGRKEVPLLLNTNLSAIGFALPGGDSITITKGRDLTLDEKRRVGRAWKAGMSLYDLEAASHGTIQVDAKIKKAASTERIWIEPLDGSGAPRSVPRWVYDMFLAEEAEGRFGKAWRIREDGPK